MKYPKLLLFIILIIFLSCANKNSINIQGDWYTFDLKNKDTIFSESYNYEEYYFSKKKLYVVNEYSGFMSPKTYEVKDDSLFLFWYDNLTFSGKLDTIAKDFFRVSSKKNIQTFYKINDTEVISKYLKNKKIDNDEYHKKFQDRLNSFIRERESTNRIKHAKGFDIQHFTNYTKLIIKAPYPNATAADEFYFLRKNAAKQAGSVSELTAEITSQRIIKEPLKKVVVTSTTHIPMLELLGEETSLIGFPNLQYISSKKTVDLIKQGNIRELGREQNINTEVLLDLQPDAVIGFSLNSNNKLFTTIEKAGIPVILNGDWLEETPLGRAEWIKFFGVLFGKEKQADSIFNQIEKEYLAAKTIAQEATHKPTILSGIEFNQVWNVPAGKSFVAQFLKDANTDYLWANTTGKGSHSLSFESVFEKAQDADIWIDAGQFTSYTQLQKANNHYTKFKPFRQRSIYTYSLKKGENGGVIYYELAPIQPHIVLKDLIKISHPELLPDYHPYFLEKLHD